jgi:hypothetical protein
MEMVAITLVSLKLSLHFKCEEYKMDLSTLETSETFDVIIVHPVTSEPIGLTITVYGSDSLVCQNAKREQVKRRLDKSMKNGKIIQKNLLDSDTVAEQLEILVACTKSFTTENNEPLKLSNGVVVTNDKDGFRKLYSTSSLNWIFEQVEDAIGDRENFLQKR